MSLKSHIKDLFTLVPVSGNKKVLMWHNVVDDLTPVFNLRTHRQDDFYKQIKAIQHRHTLTGPEEWIAAKSDAPVILITFDDGLRNNIDFAVPVLEATSTPAIFFISAEGIENEGILWPDEVEWLCFSADISVSFGGKEYKRHPHLPVYVNDLNERLVHQLKMYDRDTISNFIAALRERCTAVIPETYRIMSPANIRSMANNKLFSLGSHSYQHLPLASMELQQQSDEISHSLSLLEKICGRKINCLAFPDGSFNDDTLRVCSELNIPLLFGVGKQSVLNVIPRTGLYTDASWKQQLVHALS